MGAPMIRTLSFVSCISFSNKDYNKIGDKAYFPNYIARLWWVCCRSIGLCKGSSYRGLQYAISLNDSIDR